MNDILSLHAAKAIKAALSAATAIGMLTIAQQVFAQDDEAQTILQSLRKQYPATQFDRIEAAPVAGLYEVTLGKTIIYTDKQARYWLFGYVFDPKTMTDLTQAKLQALDKVDSASLPRQLAIRRVNGNPSRTLFAFADPNCGHCKALEQQLDKLDNTEIYTFPVPILGEDSASKVRALWCAANPSKAWRDWMLLGALPSSSLPGCSAPVDQLMALVKRLKVEGTPTLVTSDGRKRAGGASAAELMTWMTPAQSAGGSSVAIKQ